MPWACPTPWPAASRSAAHVRRPGSLSMWWSVSQSNQEARGIRPVRGMHGPQAVHAREVKAQSPQMTVDPSRIERSLLGRTGRVAMTPPAAESDRVRSHGPGRWGEEWRVRRVGFFTQHSACSTPHSCRARSDRRGQAPKGTGGMPRRRRHCERGRLRKVRGSCPTSVDPGMLTQTRGTETSQYPEE